MIIEMGLADDRELDEVERAVRGHLDDPRTVVMSGHMVLARGRRPGDRSGKSRPVTRCIRPR
jgi:hypothetical protein